MNEPTDKYNVILAEDVLHYIEDHPEEWYQGSYYCGVSNMVDEKYAANTCGTVACFAGHAVHMNGWHMTIGNGCIDLEGTSWSYFDAGMELLGLTSRQAQKLFNGANTLDDLKTLVKMIANGEDISGYENEYEREFKARIAQIEDRARSVVTEND